MRPTSAGAQCGRDFSQTVPKSRPRGRADREEVGAGRGQAGRIGGADAAGADAGHGHDLAPPFRAVRSSRQAGAGSSKVAEGHIVGAVLGDVDGIVARRRQETPTIIVRVRDAGAPRRRRRPWSDARRRRPATRASSTRSSIRKAISCSCAGGRSRSTAERIAPSSRPGAQRSGGRPRPPPRSRRRTPSPERSLSPPLDRRGVAR